MPCLYPRLLFFIALSVLLPKAIANNSINLDTVPLYSLGQYALILEEKAHSLSAEAAYQRFQHGSGSDYPYKVISTGVNSPTLWLAFRLSHSHPEAINKRLSIETSWLDYIDVYQFKNDKQLLHLQGGDKYHYQQRSVDSRFFHFDLEFTPGKSTLLVRIATPDPKVVPIYLRDKDQQLAANEWQAYFYGLLYGVIAGLLCYNLLLSISLKKTVYLFYALYMLAFLLMNSSYTGHNFRLLWPHSPTWQMWSNAIFMTLHVVMGLQFAIRFLSVEQLSAKLYHLIMRASGLMLGSLVLAIAINNHKLAISLAFLYMSLFAATMIYVGIIALKSGTRSAKYFLLASLCGAGGATVTCITVMGIIPYSHLAFPAIDIGMMLEAILLALALADQFHRIEQEKTAAEALSLIDPLTNLNNRRAFNANFLNHQNQQKTQRILSVIIIDIDHFKNINDNYGHIIGDKVLIEVANVLNLNTRNHDFLARWGGEEFIACLPGCSLQQAINLAERYRKAVAELSIIISEHQPALTLTISLGVSCNNQQAISMDKLIILADKHLYTAKEQGRNQVVWHSTESEDSLASKIVEGT